MEKKTVFIFTSDRQEAEWLMKSLKINLESFNIRVNMIEWKHVLTTPNCEIKFFYDLDYAKFIGYKADETFNFPGDSGLEFRKPSDIEPWPLSAFDYILRVEMEANRVEPVVNPRAYVDKLFKSIYGTCEKF